MANRPRSHARVSLRRAPLCSSLVVFACALAGCGVSEATGSAEDAGASAPDASSPVPASGQTDDRSAPGANAEDSGPPAPPSGGGPGDAGPATGGGDGAGPTNVGGPGTLASDAGADGCDAGAFPEVEPNDTPAQAMEIRSGVTCAAVGGGQDTVDYFHFKMKPGNRPINWGFNPADNLDIGKDVKGADVWISVRAKTPVRTVYNVTFTE